MMTQTEKDQLLQDYYNAGYEPTGNVDDDLWFAEDWRRQQDIENNYDARDMTVYKMNLYASNAASLNNEIRYLLSSAAMYLPSDVRNSRISNAYYKMQDYSYKFDSVYSHVDSRSYNGYSIPSVGSEDQTSVDGFAGTMKSLASNAMRAISIYANTTGDYNIMSPMNNLPWFVRSKLENLDMVNGRPFEIPTAYRSQYPHNKVNKTPSGHVFEVDDTPDGERVSYTHPSGTSIEAMPDGTIVIKVVKNAQLIVQGEQKVHVHGSREIHVDATDNLIVAGNSNIEVGGNVNMQVGGSMQADVKGNVHVETGGDCWLHAQGNLDLTADGYSRVHSKGTMHFDCEKEFKVTAPKINLN